MTSIVVVLVKNWLAPWAALWPALLFLGQLPEDLIGWWYMFFQPGRIRALEAGQLYASFQPQVALRLVIAAEGGRQQTLYLSFVAPAPMHRVRGDLALTIRSASG